MEGGAALGLAELTEELKASVCNGQKHVPQAPDDQRSRLTAIVVGNVMGPRLLWHEPTCECQLQCEM